MPERGAFATVADFLYVSVLDDAGPGFITYAVSGADLLRLLEDCVKQRGRGTMPRGDGSAAPFEMWTAAEWLGAGQFAKSDQYYYIGGRLIHRLKNDFLADEGLWGDAASAWGSSAGRTSLLGVCSRVDRVDVR